MAAPQVVAIGAIGEDGQVFGARALHGKAAPGEFEHQLALPAARVLKGQPHQPGFARRDRAAHLRGVKKQALHLDIQRLAVGSRGQRQRDGFEQRGFSGRVLPQNQPRRAMSVGGDRQIKVERLDPLEAADLDPGQRRRGAVGGGFRGRDGQQVGADGGRDHVERQHQPFGQIGRRGPGLEDLGRGKLARLLAGKVGEEAAEFMRRAVSGEEVLRGGPDRPVRYRMFSLLHKAFTVQVEVINRSRTAFGNRGPCAIRIGAQMILYAAIYAGIEKQGLFPAAILALGGVQRPNPGSLGDISFVKWDRGQSNSLPHNWEIVRGGRQTVVTNLIQILPRVGEPSICQISIYPLHGKGIRGRSMPVWKQKS